MLRVLIVEDDTLVGMGLSTHLKTLGHEVVGQASDDRQAHELFTQHAPDLVLLDIRLDQTDGIQLAEALKNERRVPMIIISAYGETELVRRAAESGVFGYLIKPVSEAGLAAQIEIATRRFNETESLRQETQKLTKDLETRRLMDRAKAVLIKRAKLTEDESHRRLQQESQKRRIPLAELCKKVIESDELLG